MNTQTMTVIIAVLFVLVVIIGFLVYRKKVNVKVELPGSKLNFEGSNDGSSDKQVKSSSLSGIFKNFSIGKTRLEVQGHETIAKNVNIGDTEIKAKE